MIYIILKYIQKYIKKIKNIKEINTIIVFLIISILFGLYMMIFENLSLIDTWYFIISTATTVGYGDISPQKEFGRFIFPIYMIFGIGILSILISEIVEKLMEYNLRKRKGNLKMKKDVDLLIVGYPSEDKVKEILNQLNIEEKEEFNVVLLNDKLDEIPIWFNDMKNLNILFIKGFGSDVEILKKSNIYKCKKALILAKDQNNITSDDYNSSTVAVIKHLNSKVYTIVEKVRKDDILYSASKADLIIPVSPSNIIAQEILDPGAIDLVNAIFDNETEGTQFNYVYNGEEKTWSDIAINLIMEGLIPEGYKRDTDYRFNVIPKPKDLIKEGTVIKYRGSKRIY